jgi:hypothetical protein
MLQIVLKLRASLKAKWKTIILVFPGLIVFIWLNLIAIAPLHKINELSEAVYNDSVFAEKFDSTYYYPEMSNLVKEKGYRVALLQLAENDSLQLVINLDDSTVNLSIKGVVIHQTQINEFSKDKFFKKISLIQEYKLFSRPLLYHSTFATIVKEPVVLRHAPKDTSEAALNAWQPDTLIQNPAFVAFLAEHNIRIILEQNENNYLKDKWVRFQFYSYLFFRDTAASLKNLIYLEKQEYQPTVTIKLPVDDLRAIYRALPHTTYLVLKL